MGYPPQTPERLLGSTRSPVSASPSSLAQPIANRVVITRSLIPVLIRAILVCYNVFFFNNTLLRTESGR